VQTVAAYLYSQNIELMINLDPVPYRENTLVYAKLLQIYKGIDNKFNFTIRNQDQKLQSLLDTKIIFNLMSTTTGELIFSRLVKVVTDRKGLATITLEQIDLNDVNAGVYNYSVILFNGEGQPNIVYADDNYNAQGQCRVNDAVYPTFIPSVQPNLGPFYNNNPNQGQFGYSNNNILFSDVVNVFDRVKTRSVLQTVQYYGNNFSGTVNIQGSLNAAMKENPDDWFTIDTQNFANFSGCAYSTFTGKIGLVRFNVITTSGSLDKILYRP
jgi:hypothetical protein